MVTETNKSLILASSSPRRKELIEQLGLSPRVVPADIDETPGAAEKTRDYVLRLSLTKATKVADQLTSGAPVVVGADTVIDFQGQIMGKPASLEQSIDMLCQLSAQTHQVQTGVTVISGSLVESCNVVTEVTLCKLSLAEIRAYWQSGEPRGKAGSYAIQGKGARFVEKISGSYSNVVGLPLYETAKILARCGIEFD